MYCASSSYGQPCIYSPTNTHVHADEPNKCIYCGSTSYGSGCAYNPYSNYHVRGGTIFMQIQEQVKKSAVMTHMLEMLQQKNDKKYKSPLDRMYKRLSEMVLRLSEPLLEAFAISQTPIIEGKDANQTEEIENIKDRLVEEFKDIRATLKYANAALPVEIVEKILISAILDSDDKF